VGYKGGSSNETHSHSGDKKGKGSHGKRRGSLEGFCGGGGFLFFFGGVVGVWVGGFFFFLGAGVFGFLIGVGGLCRGFGGCVLCV